MIRKSIYVCSALCSGLVPLAAVADEFSYIPSERRHFPAQQYPAETTGKQAPVTPPPIRPLPRSAYNPTQSGRYDYDNGFSVELETGYRTDDLQWNIANGLSASATPNILSELTWKDVQSYQFAPKISYTQRWGLLKGLHFEGQVKKAVAFAGDNQDSDYAGDNRTSEFSRSNNDAEDGDSTDYSAALGYAFEFSDDRNKTLARFMALVGYARQQEKFVMTNGNQTLETFGVTPPLGPFSGLNSTYEATWSTPFVGASVEGYFFQLHRLKLHGKYYKGDYDGEANWNLRGDFAHPKSFEHKADGKGYSMGVQYGWQFYPHAEFTLSAEYFNFRTDPGVDTTFFSNGSSASIRLNKVEWESQQYMAGIGYTF